MSRSNKSRIAVILLGTLAFGANDVSAMNSSTKNPKVVSAPKSGLSESKDTKLGSRNERIEKGVSVLKRGLLKKVLMGLGITVSGFGAASETMAGVMWAKDEESDSILKGKYSVTNLIRSKIKKNEDEDKNPNPEGNDKKDDQVQDQDLNLESQGFKSKIGESTSSKKIEDVIEKKKVGLSNEIIQDLKQKFFHQPINYRNYGRVANVSKETFDEFLCLLNNFFLSDKEKFKDEGYVKIMKILNGQQKNFHVIATDIDENHDNNHTNLYFVAEGDYVDYLKSQGCAFWVGNNGRGRAQLNGLVSDDAPIIEFDLK